MFERNFLVFLNILGLTISFAAAVIMLYPYLKVTHNVNDDFIEEMDEVGNYRQRKHIKDRRTGISGFVFYCVGFVLQLITIFVK